MNDKNLRRLSRKDLLEILLEQTKRIEELERSLEEAESQIASKKVVLSEAGTLADAALKLSDIFKVADDAVMIYKQNFEEMMKKEERQVRKELKETQEKMLEEVKEKCAKKIEQTENKCKKREELAEKRVLELENKVSVRKGANKVKKVKENKNEKDTKLVTKTSTVKSKRKFR